jgi:hypothetical protein
MAGAIEPDEIADDAMTPAMNPITMTQRRTPIKAPCQSAAA